MAESKPSSQGGGETHPFPQVTLHAAGPVRFAGNSGQILRIGPVIALHRVSLEPVPGVRVRFRVLEGPIQLTGTGKETELSTDRDGTAAAEASFTAIGAGLIVAELVGDPKAMVFFRGHSEQTTDRLFIYCNPTFPAESGVVAARIVALDHQGRPVSGAKLVFEGTSGPDSSVTGTVRELADGGYQARLRTRLAGPWEILVQDTETLVTAHACIHVLPGPPHRLQIVGDTDPRSSPPYGELLLRTKLEDRFGNGLDPQRIRCRAAGRPVKAHSLVGSEARFPIRFAGYGESEVVVSDRDSEVTNAITIRFAAAWLQEPGPVFLGATFRTPLFGLPPPDRPARRATIEVELNRRRVEFVGLEPGHPLVKATPTLQEGLLSIALESKRPLAARDFPDGIPICTILWRCREEGQTCFQLVGKMSPSTPKWELCVDQKRELRSCICINVIYPPGNAAARAAGVAIVNEVPTIISSANNVAQCCPILRVGARYSEISAADWARIARAIGVDRAGVPTVTAHAQYTAVFNSGISRRDRCINIYMIQVAVPVPGGTEQGRMIIGPPGTGVIDPGAATSGNNVGTHEVVHALGVNGTHASAAGQANNLMSTFQPHGNRLTAQQCRTIFENIDSYPC